MGAAGYVSIYDSTKVRELFGVMFPENDIDSDWWYLHTITTTLDGKKWIMDYWDDQSHHEGSMNDFWFSSKEAQQRVREVLRAMQRTGDWNKTEVWT